MIHRRCGVPLLAAMLAINGCADTRSGDAAPVVEDAYATMDDGVRLSYRAHGPPSAAQTVVAPMAIYLEDALAPLAGPNRRMVFYDPRNRGRSDRGPLEVISLDRQMRDLDALRAHLGVDSMALIGFSGLGMEMAAYAIRHPGRVTRLVQAAPVPPAAAIMRAAGGDRRATRMDTAALNALDARFDRGEFQTDPATFCRQRNALTLPGSLHDLRQRERVPDVCVHENEWPVHLWPYFGRLLGSHGDYDWRDELPSLTIPRLVIHGTEDGIPMAGAEAWARHPNARLVVLDEASHMLFIDRPTIFLRLVDEFLRGSWPAEAVILPSAAQRRSG